MVSFPMLLDLVPLVYFPLFPCHVLHIPKFPFKLLSVSKLIQSLNFYLLVSSPFPLLIVFFKISRVGRRLVVGLSSVVCITLIRTFLLQWFFGHSLTTTCSIVVLVTRPFRIWRRRSPHVSRFQSLPCEACELSKYYHVPFPPRVERLMSNPFRLVHSDVWRLTRVPSLLGFHYFIIFFDYYNQVTYLYLIKNC